MNQESPGFSRGEQVKKGWMGVTYVLHCVPAVVPGWTVRAKDGTDHVVVGVSGDGVVLASGHTVRAGEWSVVVATEQEAIEAVETIMGGIRAC